MYENMDDILRDLDLKEILGYAIASEETASTSYRMMVKIFDTNELVANKFESIAKDEELHMKSLLNLHMDVYGSDQYTVPEGLPPFESRAEVDSVDSLLRADGQRGDGDLLALALLTELQRLLDGVLVELGQQAVDTDTVDGVVVLELAVGRGVRHVLHTDNNVHGGVASRPLLCTRMCS